MAPPDRRPGTSVLALLCAALAASVALTPFAGAATKRAYVQQRSVEIKTGIAVHLKFGSANQDGNLIVAYVVWDNAGSVAVTDSAGNEYESLVGPTQSAGVSPLRAQLFYARDVKAGPNTVTASFATAVAARAQLFIHEYTGLSHVAPLGEVSEAAGTGLAADTGEVTTHSSEQLLFAAFASDGRSLRKLTSGYRARGRRGATVTADGFSKAPGPYRAAVEQTGNGWVAQLVAFHYSGTPPKGGAKYPLRRSEDSNRYVVDQDEKPFLLSGDSPQSLFVNLSLGEAASYFSNRKSRGFNAVWINLLCNQSTGGRGDGATYDGLTPFEGGPPLSAPREAYFARVDEFIRLAAKYGITVLLNPAETIGWLDLLKAAGTDRAFEYGQYLGRRYGGFDNIVWLFGNDFQGWSTDAQAVGVVQAVSRGIRDTDSAHMHTVQLDFEVSGSLDDPSWGSLIDLSATYTYAPTYAQILVDYHRGRPTFLIEANYDFETDASDGLPPPFYRGDNARPRSLRKQAWWSMLSGATGHVYGNGYTWRFFQNWKRKYDSKAAKQMGHLRKLLESVHWYELVPDESHSIVTAGFGEFDDGNPNAGGQIDEHVADNDYVTAAATPNGLLALVYLPKASQPITVDLARFDGPVTARWFDPTNGKFRKIAGSPFEPALGQQPFSAPGLNGDKDPDWVLLLEAD